MSDLTPRLLLALRPGAVLRVRLRGGREVEATLLGNPWLEARGKPGLGRVQMVVRDVEHAARLDASFERADRANRWGSPFSPLRRAEHTVSGGAVLEVLP
jgi:hypothetical protein